MLIVLDALIKIEKYFNHLLILFMCLYFLLKYTKDKNKLIKIFPIFRRECCICMEVKTNIIRCTNLKCSDGIICHECFKKLDDRMKEKCPVCMTKKKNNY